MDLKNKLDFSYHVEIYKEGSNMRKDQKHRSVFRKVLKVCTFLKY